MEEEKEQEFEVTLHVTGTKERVEKFQHFLHTFADTSETVFGLEITTVSVEEVPEDVEEGYNG